MIAIVHFGLDYTDISHPLFIEAMGCFHLNTHKRKLRRYMIEELKKAVLEKLDELFGTYVTDMVEFRGVERIYDRVAKRQGIWCVDYPKAQIIITWTHRQGSQTVEEEVWLE